MTQILASKFHILASETKKLVSETQILACSPLNLTYKLLKKGAGTVVHILPLDRRTDRWMDGQTDSPCVLQDSVPSGPLPCSPLNLNYIRNHVLLKQGTGTADHLLPLGCY